MKIIHLAASYHPRGGGVEYHLEQINRLLVAAGHEVTVLTLAQDPDWPERETHQGATIRRIKSTPVAIPTRFGSLQPFLTKTFEKFRLWQAIWQQISLLRGAHIIQVHDVFWWLLPYWWLLPGKVFMTFHGYEREAGPTPGQRRWHQLADHLTDGSLAIGAFHEDWYGVVPDQISFGGLDGPGSGGRGSHLGDRYQKSAHQPQVHQRPQPHHPKKIIALGRLEVGTGLPELVHALALSTPETKKAWQVDIYGDGPLRQHLQKFIDQEELPIHLHGFVAGARQKLAEADVVMASQYLAILETLAAGKAPVSFVSSDFKRAYLTQAPFGQWLKLVHSPQEIAALLAEWTDQPLPILEAAAPTWARHQTWEKVMEKYQELWQSSPIYEPTQ